MNKNKKELIMIIVVVVLAFVLTVAGIIYLSGFLDSEDTATTQQDVPTIPNDSNVVKFVLDEPDSGIPPFATTPPSVTPTAPGSARPSIQVDTPRVPVTHDPVPAQRPTADPEPIAPPVVPPKSTAPATVQPKPTAPKAGASTSVASVPPTTGSYQLQMFAFRSQDTAVAQAQKYHPYYPDVYIMKADLGSDGIWYRVRCCSTDSRDEAASIKAEMERRYNVVPIIVRW